ncbi:MAG: SDR family NAD(P)-dependent oxidoreductase, partial [Kiloniellales bacterium]|nr:SDR family NAD(P)-dependent oxidoreductase [Kiloniellales bacterium]
VADYESAKASVDKALASFGRLDILINNAGVIDPIARLSESDPEDWARCIEINLIGAYNILHASLPSLIRSGGGVVVNISSGAAHHALEGWSAYCASKAGLAMMTASIASELSNEGIRVYGFQPGTVETVMQQKIRAAGYTDVAKMQPSDHLSAEIPAKAVAFLCSEGGKPFASRELRVDDRQLQIAISK